MRPWPSDCQPAVSSHAKTASAPMKQRFNTPFHWAGFALTEKTQRGADQIPAHIPLPHGVQTRQWVKTNTRLMSPSPVWHRGMPASAKADPLRLPNQRARSENQSVRANRKHRKARLLEQSEGPMAAVFRLVEDTPAAQFQRLSVHPKANAPDMKSVRTEKRAAMMILSKRRHLNRFSFKMKMSN